MLSRILWQAAFSLRLSPSNYSNVSEQLVKWRGGVLMQLGVTVPKMIRVWFAFNALAFSAVGTSGEVAVDFARDIQPVVSRHCSKCHAADEKNGSVNFDDLTTLFGEADTGRRPIVAGKPQESELIKRIQSTDEEIRMPPEGERLTKNEIELLVRWIGEGAKLPNTAPTTGSKKIDSQHWSFQPISNPDPPPSIDPDWPLNPIDNFIQSRQASIGVQVLSDTDPATFIRRASYSLTGLPPTPNEVRNFVTASKNLADFDVAIEKLVDDLLNRIKYGERWGRHWMDWVRYSDTAGDNSDFPIPQAYLYRNYIIEAFNHDWP
jgi:mono/diheme cytochrome c family protein